MVKFQQRYQMRHRNSRSEDLCRGVASAVYEPVGSTPSPPHSLSGGMIALNHPNRSVNPREFLQAEKEDQEMAEACKRLIKNCIICWNYLYLSQKLEELKDTASREALLDAVAHGSAVAWRHLNLLGEYDFSDEKLRDSVGIRLPKLDG